ncbi:hypothetical protein L9F63_002858, partial [Diploptera punctata]
ITNSLNSNSDSTQLCYYVMTYICGPGTQVTIYLSRKRTQELATTKLKAVQVE